MADLSAAEGKLGYVFKDKQLLERCFTHSSYANAHGGESNERLEFLGDALLGFLVAEELYGKGGSEGAMTAERIRLVAAQPLARAVRAAGLDAFLLHAGNAGEKSVSSLFEALIAGIYLDGGMEPARAFVRANLPMAEEREPNYQGDLQEYLQGRAEARAVYEVVASAGAPHAPTFTVRASACGLAAEGAGTSRRAAEKEAAKNLLALLLQGGGAND